VNGKYKYDVCEIQKTNITVETEAFFDSLVPKLQKLRSSGQQNSKSSTNAPFNGPQSRMAAVK